MDRAAYPSRYLTLLSIAALAGAESSPQPISWGQSGEVLGVCAIIESVTDADPTVDYEALVDVSIELIDGKDSLGSDGKRPSPVPIKLLGGLVASGQGSGPVTMLAPWLKRFTRTQQWVIIVRNRSDKAVTVHVGMPIREDA